MLSGCLLYIYMTYRGSMSHFVSINYPAPPPTLSATFKNSKQSHTQQRKSPNN